MPTRNKIGLALILVSFGLLIPGLYLPLLNINVTFSMMGMEMEILDETRSILQTIETLYREGNALVAGLILLFSVVVPLAKGLSLIAALFLKSPVARRRIDSLVRAISKWSMADVFVVGILVAFLSAKAMANMSSTLHSGFYFFLGYCLVSIASLYFLVIDDVNADTNAS
ncbi:MAG: paraquat-inducible protein A [Pseudomonadales bacterium]|nr:paraquat-inducible protein A [Pseudomonadales bacterium]